LDPLDASEHFNVLRLALRPQPRSVQIRDRGDTWNSPPPLLASGNEIGRETPPSLFRRETHPYDATARATSPIFADPAR